MVYNIIRTPTSAKNPEIAIAIHQLAGGADSVDLLISSVIS